MYVFVKNFVKGCIACQQMKINTYPTTPLLQPIQIKESRPFGVVTVDFITNLPESKGYDSIMVIVDHNCTKGVILYPCHKTIDASETARVFVEQMFKRFRLPDSIISD